MPSPENRGPDPNAEQEKPPVYSRAARYTDGDTAGAAYFEVQDVLYGSEYELSAFRFQLDQLWHVAVVGELPPAAFDQTVQTLLVDGTPETLPPNLITFFNERRIEARQIAPWVERHFRPGKSMGE